MVTVPGGAWLRFSRFSAIGLLGWQRARRLWRFHAANGLTSLVGNTVLTYWLVARFRLLPIVSSLMAIAACAVFNFLLADRCVFGDLLHGQSISTRGFSLPRYLHVVSLLRLGWKHVTDVRAGSLDLRRGAVRAAVAGINGKGWNERG